MFETVLGPVGGGGLAGAVNKIKKQVKIKIGLHNKLHPLKKIFGMRTRRETRQFMQSQNLILKQISQNVMK